MKIIDSKEQKVTYERVTFSKKSHIGTKEKFAVYFASAMEEIACTKMKINSYRLMLLLLSHLANEDYRRANNRVMLLGGKDYANLLSTDQVKVHRPRIVEAFEELEELNFIKRDKATRSVYVTINPVVAYRGKFNEYTKTHNISANLFGNKKLKESQKQIEQSQDWDSSLEGDLSGINQDM